MKNKRKLSELELHNIWSAGTIGLIALAVVIVIVMFIAWAMPESADTNATPTLLTPTSAPFVLGSGTPTPEILTMRENVGYGDGIIVFSSVLILLLLILILREQIIHRKWDHKHPEQVKPVEQDQPK